MLPTYSAEQYLYQFQRLLPRGRIWHRGWGMVQDADLLTLMPTWVRLHLRLNDLIAEIFPCSTIELLPEWEDTLGLPDPCTGPLATISERTWAVCAKFVARGGASRDYFISVAAALGFYIEIEEYLPFYAGRGRAGDPVYDESWAWGWRVLAVRVNVFYFTASTSRAGEPLATWGNRLLECTFEALKPAHTVLVFAYALDSSLWDDGFSVWDGAYTIWDRGVFVDG